MTTINVTAELVTHCCGECGTWYAMEERIFSERKRTGANFYCPNGHARHFTDTDAKKLERETARADRNAKWLREETQRREAAERSARALRGVVTRTKKRVGNGVCPCCNRTFKQLAAHMQNKHPEYADTPS